MDITINKIGHDLLLRSRAIRDLGARDLGIRGFGAGLLAVLLIYGILLVVYRLYFSPIAAIPGPKLAASTEWYEFYYSILKNGQFGHAVERMHEKYGETLDI